jgi:RHO1 GDP-GTP exchange protein 1/2
MGWKEKLEEAIGLRKVVQESNKVFETETLSMDTFLPFVRPGTPVPAWSHERALTGKVTCSIPFSKFLSPVVCYIVRWIII